MMETAKDFEEVRIGLCNGIDQEILKLKHFMESLDDDSIIDNPDLEAEIYGRIFYASKGIEKLASVLGFIDCWEENGEPPQLNQTAIFSK